MKRRAPRRSRRFSVTETLVSWAFIVALFAVLGFLVPNTVIATGNFVSDVGRWAKDTKQSIVNDRIKDGVNDVFEPDNPVVVDADRVPYNGGDVCQQACGGAVTDWWYKNETAVKCKC